MKNKRKRILKAVISYLLCIAMLAPNTTPIVAYAAEKINNTPRYVDFTRPEALTLTELGIASGSDAKPAPESPKEPEPPQKPIAPEGGTSGHSGYVSSDKEATPSDADLREPESYYTIEPDEPDGTLVQFDEAYRTYEIGDGEYITIAGGYSGLYKDEDGMIHQVDNTLVEKSSRATRTASASSAAADTYENQSGSCQVTIPARMNTTRGIRLEKDGAVMELIPTGGDFRNSLALDNAIRYSNVYPGIDYQYTLAGNVLKEDIILLEPGKKTTFTSRIKAPGLKVAQEKNTIMVYQESKKQPLFLLEAPLMTDAAGAVSTDLTLTLSGEGDSHTVTVTPDKDWLEEEERVYPVRIDPTPVTMVPSEFILATVADKQKDKFFGNTGTVYGGYREGFGNMRTYVSINGDWAQVMGQPLCTKAVFKIGTQTANGAGATNLELRAPAKPWNVLSLTWSRISDPAAEYIATATVTGKDQILEYDMTAMMQSWMSGTRLQAGLVLQAENEPQSESQAALRMPAEALYNRDNAAMGPRLEITWEGELMGDLSLLDIHELTLRVDPAVEPTMEGGRVSKGVFAYGISQGGSTVTYQLDDGSVTDEVTADTTYTSPDFTAEGAFPDAFNEQAMTGNWQSHPLALEENLEQDTIYKVSAQAKGFKLEEDPLTGELVQSEEPDESDEIESDEFLLYEVQDLDLLVRIADYYQVEENTIKRDNHLNNGLTFQGDVLFIRNPQKEKPYTPKPLTDQEKMKIDMLLMGMGKDCVFGHEPINLNTGNFYMNQTDAELPELSGTFTIDRGYNSLLPYFRSEFGIGWSSPFGERLTVHQDGDILYRKGDGGAIPFTKAGDGTYQAPDGYDMTLSTTDSIDLEAPEPETGEPEIEAAENRKPLQIATSSQALKEQKTVTVTDGGTEGEPGEEVPEEEVTPVPEATAWELKDKDGTVRTFDAKGMLHYTTDRQGHKTSYTYDDKYDLTAVTTPSGKKFAITMDEEHRITSITQPDGGSLIYAYDENNNLISVTNPEGGVRRYEYDEKHRMTAWYDENGTKIIDNVYDEENRVTAQTDALGSTAYLTYEEGLTRSTDNRGLTTEYHVDAQKRLTAIVYPDGTRETTTYTDDNRVASKTDGRGATTTYTYDENGNILTETRDDGTGASFTYNELNLPLTATDYEGNTTSYTYDEVGNLLSMTNGEGDTTTYGYDESSRLVSITDANGGTMTFAYEGAVVVSMTDGEGNETAFTYDEMNRVLTETDPLGNTIEHGYNQNGWEVTTTNKDGGVTAYVFSPAGEVRSITDPMGVTTDFTYDKLYHITSGQDALGNTLTYAYDANYNKVSETDAKRNKTTYTYDSRNRLTQITDAMGQEIKYTLDENGNITESTDRRGNTASTWYHKTLNLPTMTADKLGHETYYTYDGNGNVLKIAYPDGSKQTYAYDGAGRVIRTTAQNGLVTHISYDGNGNITEITDDETRVYTFAYDHNNRLVRTTDPLGGVAEYAYDAAGNQTGVTDAEAHSTGYTYDAAGRLKEVQDALDGTAAMDYNLNGLTTRTTDQNGHATTYHYDVIGQLLAQVDAQGYVTAMEYDSLGNVTKTTDALKGEVTSVYDALSRTTKLTDPMGNEYRYEYDEEGNLLKVTAPDGDTISMTYDANGQMISSTDEAGVISTYTYDSMGRVILAKDNIGNQMTYEYDEAGNLVKQTDTIGRDAIYTYDKFNRPETVTGTDGATTTYGYDALDRLVSVTLADLTVTTYEYDKVGNLIKTTEPGEATYTYAYDAINRLSEKVDPLGAVTRFRYDAKGNLTGTTDAEAAENSYLYDAIDRLTTFTDGRGNTTQYEYDELSRLLSYTTPEGNKEEYRYDANGQMTRMRDANGLITEYRYDVMGNLTEAISPKGAKTGYTYDKHDEVTGITDPAGNLVQYDVDLNRRVTKITEKNGGQYTYSYDQVHRMTEITTPLGLTRTMTYDTADNVIKDTDSLGRGSSYTYDIMHRMTKAVDSKGGVTNFGYDIRGNQNQLTDALGYTWNYNYDLIDQLTASVDPEGKATKVAYNLVGKVKVITKPGERTTQYRYDGNYNVTGVIDPKGYQYGFTYDKDNRQTGTIDPLSQTTSTTYDAGSRVTSLKDKMGLTQSFEYDPHGNVLSSKATNGLITRFGYDILDNLLQVTMPSNLTTHYTYDVMSNVTSMTDTMKRVTKYTYDLEGNMTSLTDISGRTEQMTYDAGGRITGYTSNGGNKINYDYDTLNSLVEKSYEDTRDPEGKEGVLYGYDALGQRKSMMDRSGESTYEYDGLGRITKVTTGSGEVTSYKYDGSDQLESITYPDGKKVSYKYDKNDNLTEVTDRTGAVTTYVYDAINRITEIHRPNGVSTYNTYNARDQIVSMKNICEDCDWVVSQYDYTYDDRGFITAEDAIESLYGYAWDDKHDGKHENWHDTLYPHGDKHYNKHDKDGLYGFQIIETKRSFTYDDDGKLLSATENEDRQGRYDYTFRYDDMGNRTFYAKSRNGKVQESAEYTYNSANQPIKVREYDGKHYKTVEYSYDADGNRILEEEVKPDGTRKVEKSYEYTVENRLKAVSDKNDLLAAMSYDGDGNRIFQLNYNLHTDDDWKGNSGNGNGNNKDNPGSGNSGNNSGNGTGSKTKAATETVEETTETEPGFWDSIVSFFTGDAEAEETGTKTETETTAGSNARSSNKDKDKGNNGNTTNNGVGNGNGNSGNNGNGNKPDKPDKPDKPNKPNDNTSTGGTNDNNGNANGNTNNTGGSQNQSGILFPIDGEVSELESELIGMIKTTGKHKNYELVEYVNDVNREHTEVLMELNINGIMDTAYSYGDQRLTNERFTEWTGYYTYDPRGSVTGVTDEKGMIWQSYRYDAFGRMTFGQPQYNNVYSYNAESYNPNVDAQYLRARYYSPTTADFISEDSYLGKLTDPLSLNRYNYTKSSPLNYVDPSGHKTKKEEKKDPFDLFAFEKEKEAKFDNQIWSITPQISEESVEDSFEKIKYNLKTQISNAEQNGKATKCEEFDFGEMIISIVPKSKYGTRTFGVTINFTANSRVQLNGMLGWTIDKEGNIALQYSKGANASTSKATGLQLSIGATAFATTADSYKDLEDKGLIEGGGLSGIYGGIPISLAIEKLQGQNQKGEIIWSGDGSSASIGFPTGNQNGFSGEGHVGFGVTKTIFSFNIFEIYDKIGRKIADEFNIPTK